MGFSENIARVRMMWRRCFMPLNEARNGEFDKCCFWRKEARLYTAKINQSLIEIEQTNRLKLTFNSKMCGNFTFAYPEVLFA